MKRIFILLLIIVAGKSTIAQSKMTEDSLMKIMSQEICEEMGREDKGEFTAENFQMKAGLLFFSAFQKHADELTELYGENFMTDQAKLSSIGEKIGYNMGLNCKVFLELIMQNPEMIESAMNKKFSATAKTKSPEKIIKDIEVKSVSGTVLSYTTADISFYTVSEKGKSKKVYWMDKFEGDDNLIANPKRIVGKLAFFDYEERKVYNAISKTYKTINIIISYSDEKLELIQEVKE